MPTYDYECLKCGNSFEAFQKMSDSPLKECPECKGEKYVRVGIDEYEPCTFCIC